MKLKIEYVGVGELKPYAGNAKLHPQGQIEQIKSSIEQFGFNDPIAIDNDGTIIEGHGRLLAAEELGLDKVPVIRLGNLTDQQRKAYMLAHNKLTMNTGFDLDLLDDELRDILDIDMSLFGFDTSDRVVADADADSSGSGFSYKEQYGVIVICESEAEQEDVYNRLAGEGFNCRVVTV